MDGWMDGEGGGGGWRGVVLKRTTIIKEGWKITFVNSINEVR